MEFLSGYSGEDEEEGDDAPLQISITKTPTCSAPALLASSHQLILKKSDNSKISWEPEMGPYHPYSSRSSQGRPKYGAGFIEETHVEDSIFDSLYHSYLRGDSEENQEKHEKQPGTKEKKRKLPLLPEELGDEQEGPWLPGSADEIKISQPVEKQSRKEKDDSPAKSGVGEEEDATLLAKRGIHIVEPDEEAEKWEKVNERKISNILPPRPARSSVAEDAKTVFHGKEERDYQGRSWTAVPSGIRGDDGEHECFIPKKCIKKFVGHSKGVQAVELFPKTGHLLLSASLDGKCKVWDVLQDRNVRRTYAGHTEGVRSIHMSNDGSQFLSSGFDRYVRLWDLETGQAVGTFSNRQMNYQVKFYPNDNNIFLCASSDNKIHQWDARSGEAVQEYNYHLQQCNTITFIDEGRKFVSTSDDKKILVWEYDIPVPIKYIAEPNMHSVPAVTIHPHHTHFVGQSMDNTIVTYQCGEKVKQLKRKTFRGHTNSGYACQMAFSPNGQFLASGDGLGKLLFWDFKSTKEYRKMQAHDGGPCMGVVWHPINPSWVVTCGWDGLIKLWD